MWINVSLSTAMYCWRFLSNNGIKMGRLANQIFRWLPSLGSSLLRFWQLPLSWELFSSRLWGSLISKLCPSQGQSHIILESECFLQFSHNSMSCLGRVVRIHFLGGPVSLTHWLRCFLKLSGLPFFVSLSERVVYAQRRLLFKTELTSLFTLLTRLFPHLYNGNNNSYFT